MIYVIVMILIITIFNLLADYYYIHLSCT